MKATAIAHANIAFVKYWGRSDDELNLPLNDSISMNLSNAFTKTTVEFDESLKQDEVRINGKQPSEKARNRVTKFLDLVRDLAGTELRARVWSENNFPTACGIASSASAGAALALACCKALGLSLEERFVSRLARRFSGSAARSIPAGFVRWKAATSDELSFAYSIAPPGHWKLCDIVAVVSREEKSISSAEGHRLAKTSPFLEARVRDASKRVEIVEKAILEKDLTILGQEIERDTISMHAVMMTSRPSLIYWRPETLKLMLLVRKWRREGLECYFTIDAGPNVHLICRPNFEREVVTLLKEEGIDGILTNYPGEGARLTDKHLF